jgi:hypothetical protein
MPIDPNISLAAQGPQPVTLNNVLQLNQMMRQQRMDQQQQQSRNALSNIYRSPGMTDANGMPTPEAMKQISAIDPNMGMQLRMNQAQLQAQGSLNDERKMKAFQARSEAVQSATEPALTAYDQAISQGMAPQQAINLAQKAYNEGIQNLANSGMFSDQEVSNMAKNFDPNRVRAGAIRYKDWLSANRQDKNQELSETRLEAQMKHQERMEGLSESRLGLAEHNAARADRNAEGDPNAKIDSDTLNVMAQQYLAGDNSVFTNLGRGRQGAQNVIALRRTIMDQAKSQGIDGSDIASRMAEFGGIKSGERALGTRTAQIGMAVNEATKFAKLAEDASKAFPRGSFVPVNRAMVAYADNTSDPKLKAFGAANLSFINAYARAVGGGSPTVSDKEHAREMLSTADGPEAYSAVINQLQKEMVAAKESPGAVRDEFREAVTRKGSNQVRAVNPKTGHVVVWNGSAWVDE